MAEPLERSDAEAGVTITLPPAVVAILPELIEALERAHIAAVRLGLAGPGRRR